MTEIVERYGLGYLSASRLACYDRCPQLFHERYIQKLPHPPSVERQFGTALHKGLEAHFRGQDYEMAFLVDWRKSVLECRAAGLFVSPAFTQRGLQLIDQVRALGLQGEPERRINLVAAALGFPIIGYADLWDGTTVWDFKSTGAKWGSARAEREVWQPALYSQAIADELQLDTLPKFTFVVLPRIAGDVYTLDGSRTPGQVVDALDRAREIYQRIRREEFTCQPHCVEHREAA